MNKYKYPIILSLIVFLACIAYSFYFKIPPRGDEQTYDNVAVNFLNGKGFIERLDIPIYKDRGIFYSTLGQGYVIFLAFLYKLFGHYYAVVWIVQALLHALTALFLFFICLLIFKDSADKIGLLAMGIYGFWPDLIESTAMLLTEPVFLFFAVLTIYFLIKFFQKPKIATVFLLSSGIALGSSIRPTLNLILLVIAVLILVRKPQKWPIYLLILIVFPILISVLFMYRNYVQYNRFTLTTTAGYDLWVGNNINANGEFEIAPEIRNYFENYGFFDIGKKGISEVKKFATEYPVKFIKLQMIKTSKYFSLIRPSGWWPHLNKVEKSLTLLFSGLFGAIGFIFGISGMWKAFKGKDFFHRLLVYLAVCGPVAVIPIVVGTRYRYQIYPLLAIFAAYFLINLFQKRQKILYKIPLTIFAVLVLNSIYDLITNYNVFLEHVHRIIK
jgi:hypothetical protein